MHTDVISAPIGIFDSGLGGLTVAREIAAVLPHESFIYVGDTARCPYGPRDLDEVQGFVRQICSFLVDKGVKLIVIACNTATAAGLELAQREFEVPLIGVIEPGARAAVRATRNRCVGVIGTTGTVESGVYEQAILALDAGCDVISVATPAFVELVEDGLAFGVEAGEVAVPQDFSTLAADSLGLLRREGIDTLVLGCTHYPLLQHAIAAELGSDVVLVSSAEETARDVCSTLRRRGHEADSDTRATYTFFTTGDCARFAELGARVFGTPLADLDLLDVTQLPSCASQKRSTP